MGLSASRTPRADARRSERKARDAFLSRLTEELGALRTRVDESLSDPADGAAREVLANKFRALAGDASRVGQVQLAEELSVVRAVLQSVGVLEALSDGDRRHLHDAFTRIGSYLEAERNREIGSTLMPAGTHPRAKVGMLRVLLVGTVPVAESLLAEDWAAEDDAPAIMVEACPDASSARYEVKRKAPDVIVVDSDVGGARVLVDRLVSDDETEEIPIVVLGKWDKAEDAASFVALGVSRTLAKPVSPGALRRACLDVARGGARPFEPLGQITLDGLGARLSVELHRGLCDAAEDTLRKKAVELGDGAAVLTVMWDAIARIRELVTAQSKGAVRFHDHGVVGALPTGAGLTVASRRPHNERSSAQNEVRAGGDALPLDGFRICVAEDDLSTNWFLCGVLRETGATVTGVFDGRKALDHVYREQPDLLLSDIVMPELDGFALCRTVKRDALLRSTSVLLLSWKPDLLQRMRELGAGADGYLLKEASGREIMQRVHELLRPRRVLERRIAEGGTVRGRLDGVSAVALLKIASQVRPMSRLTIRDARFVYELELRAGRPVLATRTAEDGTATRGKAVIAALLGIGGGRFTVADIDEGAALSAELVGSLEDQLVEPIAWARAAQGLLSGTQLMRVHRVVLDDERLEPCLGATPEPARSLVRALAAGAAPRDLIAEARASAELVERVLCDAARQGAVARVHTAAGEVLRAAVDREIAVMSGVALPETAVATIADACVGLEGLDDDPPPLDVPEEVLANTPVDALDELGFDEPSESHPFALEPRELSGDGGAPEPEAGRATPVIARAVAAVVPAPAANRNTPILARVEPDAPAFATVESKRRVADELEDDVDDELDETPSENTRARDKAKHRRRSKRRRRRDGSEGRSYRRDDYADERDDSETPPPARPRHREPAFSAPEPQPDPRLPRLPMPSAWAPRGEPTPPKKRPRWTAPLLFGLAGVGLAIGARYMRENQPYEPQPAPLVITPQVADEAAAAEAEGPPRAPEAPGAEADDVSAAYDQPVELPLSKSEAAKLAKDQGLLEVVAGRGHEVFVDGKSVGRGPVVKVPVKATAQPHEVRVKLKGEERVRYVVMKPNTRLRLRLAPPWSR